MPKPRARLSPDETVSKLLREPVTGHTATTRRAALASANHAEAARVDRLPADQRLYVPASYALPEPAPIELRPARVISAQWRDPADSKALERDTDGRRHQQTITGYRVQDPLQRLPCASEHHRAASKLRRLHDVAEGVRIGDLTQDRVDGGTSVAHDPSGAQLDAIQQRRRVFDALGPRACAYVVPVVLSGWTVADLVARLGGNAMSVQGRVMAGLDRLVEVLEEPRKERATIMVPGFVDRHGTGLARERMGRVAATLATPPHRA